MSAEQLKDGAEDHGPSVRDGSGRDTGGPGVGNIVYWMGSGVVRNAPPKAFPFFCEAIVEEGVGGKIKKGDSRRLLTRSVVVGINIAESVPMAKM